MNIKRVTTALLAALLVAGVGVTTSNVSAKHYHHLRSHRVVRRHSRNHVRKARRHSRKRTRVNRRRHLSVGQWYVKNARRYWNHADDSDMYDAGQSDAASTSDTAGDPTRINPHHYYNRLYRIGWVTTYANNDYQYNKPGRANGGDTASYTNANNLYKRGVRYLKSVKTRHDVGYNPSNNSWKIYDRIYDGNSSDHADN